jgi:hypothetical protein
MKHGSLINWSRCDNMVALPHKIETVFVSLAKYRVTKLCHSESTGTSLWKVHNGH